MENTEIAIDTSLSDLSLADYRAHREEPAVAEPPKKETPEAAKPATANADETTADSEPAEDTASEEDGDQSKPKAKGQGGFQKKISKLTREKEDLERKLASYTAAPPAEKVDDAAKPEVPAYNKPKPTLETSEGIEDYAEKLTDWKADERDFKKTQEALAAVRQREGQELVDGWNGQKAAVAKEHPDFDAVLKSVEDIKLSREHQRIFLDSELGAEIAYQLAQDRDELTKFASMSPLAAARYFGGLERDHADAPPETKISGAPKPMRPLSSRASATATKDPSKMSLPEYRAFRAKTAAS